MSLRRFGWAVLVATALLVTAGCGSPQPDDPLRPPSIYRNPQVHVTRAPTVIVTETPEVASEPTNDTPVFVQPVAWPTTDIEQLMNDIESQLTEMERDLDRIDTDP
jgi:hypothetical protein